MAHSSGTANETGCISRARAWKGLFVGPHLQWVPDMQWLSLIQRVPHIQWVHDI